MNNFVAAPDLVVESVTTSGSDVSVVIRNNGTAATTDGFWVDLFVNPSVIPTQVNDTLDTLSATGLVWGVEETLAAGESITLTRNGTHFDAASSNFSGAFAASDVLYTHVDSAHRDQPVFGGVNEIHEINNMEYNNITRTVVQ